MDYATSFPAASDSDYWGDRLVTQGHADYCADHGHATWTRDGVDVGRCPRCGDTTTTIAPAITPAYTTVEGTHEGASFGHPTMPFIPLCECGSDGSDFEYAGVAQDGTFDTDVDSVFGCRECGRVFDAASGHVFFQYDMTAEDVIRASNIYGLELAGM